MSEHRKKTAKVEDIARLLDKIAPSDLSEEWDNCGLQVGSAQWEIKKIWIALDPLASVIEQAGHASVDMVVTHHPLIFKALKRVDVETFEGKIIGMAIRNRTAIFTAHTNLDSAVGGINDVLAEKIGLRKLSPLSPSMGSSDGRGAKEASAGVGIGRIGALASPVTVKQWVADIKGYFGLKHVKVAGNQDMLVHRAAVCSGSGSSLMDTFLKSNADVFVSGDLRYHDARTVEDAGRAFIDIGHFASEHIILDVLAEKLTSAVIEAGWHVEIESCMAEKDPFKWI